MSILDPQRLYSGFSSVLGGVDGGRNPALIRDDQLAKAVNLSFRDGQVTIRPGYDRVDLEFKDTAAADAYSTGTLQGAKYLRTMQGARIVEVIGGRVYVLTPESENRFRVDDVTPAGETLRSNVPVVMQQAGRFIVIQDGTSQPFIFDGFICRSAVDKEVPVGTVMAYGMGRLWVANGNQIYAGDLVGTSQDAEIKFTEYYYLQEGGFFFFPHEFGTVRALVFPALQDTATGQGELLVMGEYGTVTIFASLPRDQWKDTPGVVRVHLRNYGPTGPAAYTLVNSDVFYRSLDGVRSYRQARAQQDGWGQTPISDEMSRELNVDPQALLTFAKLAAFDNRLYVTTQPRMLEDGTVRHSALAVMDFTPVNTLQGASPPIWEGLWTGLNVVDMVPGIFSGQEQLYFVTRDSDNRNRCYRLNQTGLTDAGNTPITAILETKRYDFQSAFDEKELYGGDLWFEDMQGEVSIVVRFRPDGFYCWADWQTVNECALMQTAAAENCYLPTPRPQHRKRVKLHTPPETPDPVSFNFLRRGMTFQARLEITGAVTITKFRLHAKAVVEDALNA